ncbi:hypothetical protein ZIOFF_076004 [Zingiber officinale]|uniref:Pre-rRNA-processing protein ESF2 n=1 Tax=Zingiber officinale TaxID=94328 RepID=A0A8J5C488_ZINOF|nr:hypothetical protein ZIOFF_076004 [Zingiber officinale]
MEHDEEQEHGHVKKEDSAWKNSGGSKYKIKKKRSREDAEREGKHGICYLSRVPPRMDPSHIRQILSQYGEIQRIYLVPEDDAVKAQRKQSGGFRGKGFSEGAVDVCNMSVMDVDAWWVEFTKKSVAKEVASMLNGEQIGGKRRSAFFYDIWNIKYLSKFKWDDLVGEVAIKKHEREEKFQLAISAAKRERDFYLSKLEQSKALRSIKEKKDKACLPLSL